MIFPPACWDCIILPPARWGRINLPPAHWDRITLLPARWDPMVLLPAALSPPSGMENVVKLNSKFYPCNLPISVYRPCSDIRQTIKCYLNSGVDSGLNGLISIQEDSPRVLKFWIRRIWRIFGGLWCDFNFNLYLTTSTLQIHFKVTHFDRQCIASIHGLV